jgi:hypothetical protein
MTAEGTISKGTGSISCEVEFCIFYRLSLRTLQTKDVILSEKPQRFSPCFREGQSYNFWTDYLGLAYEI